MRPVTIVVLRFARIYELFAASGAPTTLSGVEAAPWTTATFAPTEHAKFRSNATAPSAILPCSPMSDARILGGYASLLATIPSACTQQGLDVRALFSARLARSRLWQTVRAPLPAWLEAAIGQASRLFPCAEKGGRRHGNERRLGRILGINCFDTEAPTAGHVCPASGDNRCCATNRWLDLRGGSRFRPFRRRGGRPRRLGAAPPE